MGVRSVEQAIEIQSQYVSRAYDTYMAEMSKLGELYAGGAVSTFTGTAAIVGGPLVLGLASVRTIRA